MAPSTGNIASYRHDTSEAYFLPDTSREAASRLDMTESLRPREHVIHMRDEEGRDRSKPQVEYGRLLHFELHWSQFESEVITCIDTSFLAS
jgi:hypothetical protein